MAWVLQYQIRWQFAPIWKLLAEVLHLEPGQPIPSGACVLHLIDKLAEAEGALGFHDEDGNEVPYGHIGIETSLEAGVQPSEVVSHEGLELLADPHVNLTAFDPTNDRLYPVEVGDPVQGGSYDLGAPYNRKTGWIVADFVDTSWFDPNTPAHQPTSYRHTVSGPFALGKGGYVSYATTLPPNYQQELDRDANPKLVEADHRLQRRMAA
jgi:hypothetical protein